MMQIKLKGRSFTPNKSNLAMKKIFGDKDFGEGNGLPEELAKAAPGDDDRANSEHSTEKQDDQDL